MVRSFSNRLFAGVCGGLASRIPINAWVWRVLFLITTPLLGGAPALVYLLWWWMLPLESPLGRESGGGLRGLLAFLLSIGLIGAWFLRGTLFPDALYYPVAFLLLALVFLVQQLRAGKRGSLTPALVLLLIPLFIVLRIVGVLPAGMDDLVIRSWSALLIFFGLWVVLRHRIAFGGVIALLVSVALTVGIATLAFNARSGEKSTAQDLQIVIPNPEAHNLAAISDAITTLQINLTTLDTDVQVAVNTDGTRLIRGSFLGSSNSQIDLDYVEDGAIATFTLQERAGSDFPRLEDLGRGELRIQIPAGIAVAIAFRGERGDVFNFDLATLNLERLNLEIVEGRALVTLPRYQPLSPSVQQRPGEWTIVQGDIDVLIPDEVGVRFLLDRGRNREPQAGQTHDDLLYRVELDGNDYVLVSRRYDVQDYRVQVRVDVLNGRLRVLSSDGQADG
jgi:phage shock protein PspC (stress-responsive transcriptional regulator)